MNLKFFGSAFCRNISCVTRRNRKIENQVEWHWNKKEQFCSNNKDNSPDRSNLKKLLNLSSPLKLSPEAESIWATSPYPKGTVFQEEDNDGEPSRVRPVPEQTSIIMFPGQGNQFVGMAGNLTKYQIVKDMFESASDILGYDLLKLCQKGPEEKLSRTEYCQPAVLVCSLAALEKLKDENPWAINHCAGVCGFSLGELSALVFAGCFTFEKAVKLVKLRAEAMQACSDVTPGGMMTVLYGANSYLSEALNDAVEHCQSKGIENVTCSVAINLFAGCKVIAGHTEALNFMVNNARKYRLKKFSKLPVSGAFHTDYMREAAETFKKALKNADINNPAVKVYSNVDGCPYLHSEDIRRKLPKQIYKKVKWEQTMCKICDRPSGQKFPFFYEIGPGNSLSVALRKINNKAANTCYSVSV